MLPCGGVVSCQGGGICNGLGNKLFLITERAFAGDHFKVFVKAGKVVEAAFIAKLFDAQVVLNEQLAGLSYAYLDEELRIGLSGTGLEIAAERIGADIGNSRNFFQLDLSLVVFQ